MAGFIDNIVHEGLIILSIVLLHINRHCMPVSDANRRKKRGVAIIGLLDVRPIIRRTVCRAWAFGGQKHPWPIVSLLP
jgi:hypothetical protein